ncbi:MAG: Site-specific recombinase XerD [Chthonomonadaceae bacterium]|nr:Site-specific recombinase XerD [Chthonomonadaceae bacterium]
MAEVEIIDPTATGDSIVVANPGLPPDILTMLLADRRSENTRRAYRHDIEAFFVNVYEAAASADRVRSFLALNTPQMVLVLLRYKARLLVEDKSEATINRSMSALMSLVRFARRVGATEADPSDSLDAEKVITYRDTRGVGAEEARKLLRQPDRSTLKGKRDFALLLLLLENALRRAEICALTRGDYEPDGKSIWIHGKGRGTQRERVTLSNNTVAAIEAYLIAAELSEERTTPLFINVSPAARGRGLTTDGLYKIIKELAENAGLKDRLSPHRLRHTAITLALDASGGDVRRVQQLSRHARLETLQLYDDNRNDLQGEVTRMLSCLLEVGDLTPPAPLPDTGRGVP